MASNSSICTSAVQRIAFAIYPCGAIGPSPCKAANSLPPRMRVPYLERHYRARYGKQRNFCERLASDWPHCRVPPVPRFWGPGIPRPLCERLASDWPHRRWRRVPPVPRFWGPGIPRPLCERLASDWPRRRWRRWLAEGDRVELAFLKHFRMNLLHLRRHQIDGHGDGLLAA